MGYNILRGNPMEDGRDSGWVSPIFESNYDQKKYTSDCAYLVPAGIDMQRTVHCRVDFHSKELKTTQEFENQLEASASVSGGGWGASFSASGDYMEAVKEMKDEASIYVLSEARCMYYTSRMNPGLPPPLAKGFLTYIKELEKDASPRKYYDFFGNFGTHFAKTIDFGARTTRKHRMTAEQYETINEGAYSVEVTASYEGLLSIDTTARLSEQERKAVDTFTKNVQTSETSLGAPPNKDGDVAKWVSEVKEMPAPIRFTLISIDELFTKTYFRDIKDIDYEEIRKNIIKYKAKEEYCESFLKVGKP